MRTWLNRAGGSRLRPVILGAVVVPAAVAGIIGVAHRTPAPPSTGALELTFPCSHGGCVARMKGPGHWQRSALPGAPNPDVALSLQRDGFDAALIVTIEPLDPDTPLEDAVELFAHGAAPEQHVEELARRNVEIGGAPGRVVHAHIRNGGTDAEGYVGFVTRNDQLFRVVAVVVAKDFSAMDQELLAALRDFQLPAAERADQKPSPPLAIPLPAPAPTGAMRLDPQTSPDELSARARALVARAPEIAAVLQRAAVDKGDVEGEYNLACYESLAGHVDASLYWLERAAEDSGVDAGWAEDDSDLVNVRSDPRWPEVRAYLQRMVRYWAAHTEEQQIVTAPASPAPGGVRPLVIGMHGLGSTPEAFAGPVFQEVADKTGVGFVSLSGTRARGPHSFAWAESPDADGARVGRALAALGSGLVPAPGKLINIGFSQGAQMAVEIAARDPGRFAGAIVMSPGGRRDLELQGVPPSVSLRGRRFVVVVGKGEHPGNVALAKKDADRLRALGAEVYHHEYEGITSHTYPPDFDTALPRWISFILSGTPL